MLTVFFLARKMFFLNAINGGDGIAYNRHPSWSESPQSQNYG